jgi:hypothetical protein
MLDVRKPMGLLFVILGALLFFYGMFFSKPVPFFTPDATFPLKLNQPVGAFMFLFGALMLALARFVQVSTFDRELALRESELNRADRKRQKALAKRALAEGKGEDSVDDETESSSEDESEEQVVESVSTETKSKNADSIITPGESNGSAGGGAAGNGDTANGDSPKAGA